MTNEHDKLRIAIIVGSTRPGRRGADVAAWVADAARRRTDATYDVVDLADHPLPHLDEAMPPILGSYTEPHTRAWAATIAEYDGFIVVTPEYNHSIPGVLKNAIDFLFAEWNHKAAGVVAYGAENGARAAEHLRQIFGELKVPVVRQYVGLSLYLDFEDFERLAPRPELSGSLETLFDEVTLWGEALRRVRVGRLAAA
ncbi:NAD(P)H-dependent oxidoreductase [Nocardioides sp. HM23]|uniref:NADPH-dependent FMN reductase n=1 Tax=Nocardioides bizhenqiangii TaxID=3095076 RepID=UPI002ACA9BBD|nr:NAD(P)H-dependent oxidoreductase [Nocardioides sp. HM23]MDZ5619396.1 NAD(P)H-dependent oxidoreductase [Nocardioides sp. HM23]